MSLTSSKQKPQVLITGVSGFLGNHVCKQFVEDGTYQVRGTTTNINNTKKLQGVREACGPLFSDVELVQANLTNPDEVSKAVEGCEYVVSLASPVPITYLSKEDGAKLVDTTINAMLNILRACQQHKVKRLVITSSTAAVLDRLTATKNKVYNESNWADETTQLNPYTQSKILQEKVAWSFWKSLPEDDRFELVVICPGNMFGPFWKKEEFASASVLRVYYAWSWLFGGPKIFFQTVDVRDVALAHLQALKVEEAANQRFILVAEGMFYIDFGHILHPEFGKYYTIQTKRQVVTVVLPILSLFTRKAQMLYNKVGPRVIMDSTKSREILKIKYTPMKKSFIEMWYSMIDCGYIPNQLPKNFARPKL